MSDIDKTDATIRMHEIKLQDLKAKSPTELLNFAEEHEPTVRSFPRETYNGELLSV